MGYRKHRGRRAWSAPPFVEPAFAEALAGSRSFRTEKPNYKVRQLCRQVQRALSLAVGDLVIADVTAAPNAGHLFVHVVVPADVALAELLARLERDRPRLRAEVARVITRKRAPELSFIPSVPGGGAT